MDHSYFRSEEYLGEKPKRSFSDLDRRLKWSIKLCSPALLIYLLYLLYSGSLDALVYDSTNRIVIVLLIFLVMPALVFVICRSWLPDRVILSILIPMMSVLVNGICFGYWSEIKHKHDVYERSGIISTGYVSDAYYSKGENMRYVFVANGGIFTSLNVPNDWGYQAGDSIKVIYNKDQPNMNDPLAEFKP